MLDAHAAPEQCLLRRDQVLLRKNPGQCIGFPLRTGAIGGAQPGDRGLAKLVGRHFHEGMPAYEHVLARQIYPHPIALSLAWAGTPAGVPGQVEQVVGANLPANFTNTVTVIFSDNTGASLTNSWTLVTGTVGGALGNGVWSGGGGTNMNRSEEHTSELQSL